MCVLSFGGYEIAVLAVITSHRSFVAYFHSIYAHSVMLCDAHHAFIGYELDLFPPICIIKQIHYALNGSSTLKFMNKSF